MITFDFLQPDTVLIDKTAQSKTAVLLSISHLLAKKYPTLNAQTLFDAYWARENLGTTTIGLGVMIPHIRLRELDAPKGCFIRLKNPVNFGAEDKQPVDLVFGLVVPYENPQHHLNMLARIVKTFSQPRFRDACREASDDASLINLLLEHFDHHEESYSKNY